MNGGYIEVEELNCVDAVLSRARQVASRRRSNVRRRKSEPIKSIIRQAKIDLLREMSLSYVQQNTTVKRVYTLKFDRVAPGVSWDKYHLPPPKKWERPSLNEIRLRVMALHDVTLEDFQSKRRFRKLYLARQHFFYLCRKYTTHSFPQIGSFASKDHTTVLHGVRMWENNRRLRGCVEQEPD